MAREVNAANIQDAVAVYSHQLGIRLSLKAPQGDPAAPYMLRHVEANVDAREPSPTIPVYYASD
jgi:hypothetical protein